MKEQRKKIKQFYYKKRLKKHDFTIISNNCWGTRTYQRFGLPYQSPFQSLFIYAPDYIKLLENFSIENLIIKKFITKKESKYFDELIKDDELATTDYPIGVLVNDIELHFLHYKTAKDAKEKWDKRVQRINFNSILFKFSDGYLATDIHIKTFNQLPFKNKICFTSKEYPTLENIVYMDKFKNQNHVLLEWKYDKKYINLLKLFNSLKS